MLPGWTEVECHCSPQFTATLSNEQDLLKVTGQKSDHSGLTANVLFDEHPGQLQHVTQEGQLQFEKHFNTDTGRVMLTCHHKKSHQKCLVITGAPILGGACTHPLIPTMLLQNHPLSTSQTLIDRAEVSDPAFKEQCDTATTNAVHHNQEEHMRVPQDELQSLPPREKNHPHSNLIFQQTPIHVIRTKTKKITASKIMSIFTNNHCPSSQVL